MTILGLEFSSDQRSAAVLQVAGVEAGRPLQAIPTATAIPIPSSDPTIGAVAGRHVPPALAPSSRLGEAVESGGRATHAFALIEAALREAGVEREQVGCLAVGLGPGSYTGIRAAIAVAQGWSLGRDVRLLGISSAEGIVAEAHGNGLRDRVAVVIDAQRGEFYLADYEIGESGWQAVEPLRLTTRAEVESRAALGTALIGPEVTHWFPGGRAVFPRAATIARLAGGRTDFVRGEALEPIYLRPVNFVKAPPPRYPG